MTQLVQSKNAGVRPSPTYIVLKTLLYVVLIALALFTLIPFVWMVSASLKLDREVFSYPIRWVPEVFHWENYQLIWSKVPLLTYFKNTATIALLVTFIQTLTSSSATRCSSATWPPSPCRGRPTCCPSSY